MIDRLILSAVLATIGWNGLFPDSPLPPTPLTLKQKARERSLSKVCDKPRRSKTVNELCKKWENS